jgi:hypothetical protein
MKDSMKCILKIEEDTPNRGTKTFIVSKSEKGYFAHELGELTQWAKAFNTGELYAHRINPTVRRGNQYGIFWRTKPFTEINQAIAAIQVHAKCHIRYF